MPPSGPPTEKEIWKIARRTIDIIKFNFFTSNVCLFGSAAAALWADIGRVPHDIDIVVSKKHCNAEDIKEVIVEADDRYYLERSRKRGENHHKLYCRLPGWTTDKTRCVKVDILVPPTLNLPMIKWSEICIINDIPCMPIFDLLVMKVQGWRNRRESERAVDHAKLNDDVSDTYALLECAKQENVSFVDESDESRHTPEFISHARDLVNKFVHVNGKHHKWRALGFPVSRGKQNERAGVFYTGVISLQTA